jgi:hypothetical protein
MQRAQRVQEPFTDVGSDGGRRLAAAKQLRRIEIDGNELREGAAEIDKQSDRCHFILG